MNILGIDHVALNTLDYEKMLLFYRDVMGMQQLNSVCSEEYTATYLQVSEGVRLEIFDLKGQTKPAARTESDVGVKHIAFRVKNVKAHAKMMEDAGAKIVMPYTELKDFAAKAVLFKDPDGNIIEFCEPL